jgi:PKD repeat protein
MVMSSHIRFTAVAILLVFFLSGCAKKEEPVLENGTPVFRMEGSFNTYPQQLTAGENDYFMHTDYRVENNVYEFTGDMKRTCKGCKESLRIIIRNREPGTGAVDISKALAPDAYGYKNVIQSFALSLTSEASGGVGTVSHLWEFGDGTFSVTPNPIKILNANRKYMVTYTASYSGGCSSSLGYIVGMNPYAPTAPAASFSYTVDTADRHVYTFKVADSLATAACMWEFGDGQSGSGASVQHTYTDTGIAIMRTVKLTCIFNSDTLYTAGMIAPDEPGRCVANFSHLIIPVFDTQHTATVTVEWTDANGIVYSSDMAAQDRNSNFRILSSAPYLINERNQATQALDVLFNCKVSNGRQTVELRNMKGHIAVAHP